MQDHICVEIAGSKSLCIYFLVLFLEEVVSPKLFETNDIYFHDTHRDLQRVFLYALEGSFELEECVQDLQQEGDRSQASQNTFNPRSCSCATFINFLDWAAQQRNSQHSSAMALSDVPYPL